MYLKPVQCDAYIYFGVYTQIGEISNILFMNNRSRDELDDMIHENGLSILKIGDNARAQEYVVGKQLDYYPNFIATQLTFDSEGQMSLKHLNNKVPKIKMEKSEETAINSKLLKIGFFSNAKYYFIHSYKSNVIYQ